MAALTLWRIRFIPPPDSKEALFKVAQPPKSALAKKATPPSQCQTEIFPQCLQDFYNIPSAPATNHANNLAVSSYLNEMATESDLNVCPLIYTHVHTLTSFAALLRRLQDGRNSYAQLLHRLCRQRYHVRNRDSRGCMCHVVRTYVCLSLTGFAESGHPVHRWNGHWCTHYTVL